MQHDTQQQYEYDRSSTRMIISIVQLSTRVLQSAVCRTAEQNNGQSVR